MRLSRFHIAFFAVIFSVSGCTSNKQDTTSLPDGYFDGLTKKQAAVTDQKPRIEIGDDVEIFVKEDSAFDGRYTVRESGDIIVPKVGRIQVVGITPEGAEALVEKTLQSDQLASPSVILDHLPQRKKAPTSQTGRILVYLTGEVSRPGQHVLAYNPDLGIGAFDAVMIAGGTNRFANRSKAYVVRRKEGGLKDRIPIDLNGIESGDVPDMPLREGDIIFVPERRFGI